MKNILSILGLLCLAIVGYSIMAAPQAATAQQHSPLTQASTMTVATSPTVSAHFIDAILCTASSPACGTGEAMYSDGVSYGIDPVFALAFFRHESSYGKYGVAHDNLGLGNIRCSAGYACKHGFRAYASWSDGYIDWYKLISYYVTSWHKSTIDTIIPTYAPASENDTTGYIESIETSVREWRAEVSR